MDWLPSGKSAALCFSIDDVHPSRSIDGYDAGGDLSAGVLGRVERMLDTQPNLKATLFVTPDWRPARLVPNRFAANLPLLSRWLYHVDLHPASRFRVDRAPEFVAYLNGVSRFEVAPHGLHHAHRGPKLATEFQNQDRRECRRMLRAGCEIFARAGLDFVRGFAPPAWNLPAPLLSALGDAGFDFVASARDIRTPVSPTAKCSMSGLVGTSLIAPEFVGERKLVHIPVNFQATSTLGRADDIVRCKGLVSVKAHVFKRAGGHTAADGLDDDYCEYLERLFNHLEKRYGDSLWWTSMSEIAARMRALAAEHTLAGGEAASDCLRLKTEFSVIAITHESRLGASLFKSPADNDIAGGFQS